MRFDLASERPLDHSHLLGNERLSIGRTWLMVPWEPDALACNDQLPRLKGGSAWQ
jgi:hypothetical protein